MPKINQEEYEVLKELDDKWKWIARDKDKVLWAYDEKPVKVSFYNYWIMAIRKEINSRLFQFIKWEDESPYNIAELIVEYDDEEYGYFNMKLSREYEQFIEESEETEVKILESIREEIWEEMLRLEDKRKDQWADIKYQTLREILQKLGHLDEPEQTDMDVGLSKETINHPDHYKGNRFEAIDIIEDYELNFHLGNVVKYVLRAGKKGNKLQDLKKAQFYLNREISLLELIEPEQSDIAMRQYLRQNYYVDRLRDADDRELW